jgi:hypothetical protein
MKKAVLFFLLSFPCYVFGQGVSVDKIEQEMREYLLNPEKLTKLAIDLNNDGKEDLIYSYKFGESLYAHVYLQINGEYAKQIEWAGGSYILEIGGNDDELRLEQGTCCGESPFRLYQTYRFEPASVRLVENYIATSGYYTDGRMIAPSSILEKPYYVKTLNDNYNLRFSPDMKAFEDSDEDNFMFTCQSKTNVIATIKSGARLKVLAELPEDDRIWLYVEAEEKGIKDRCDVTEFEDDSFKDHGHPSVRGWVSGRYTEKEKE